MEPEQKQEQEHELTLDHLWNGSKSYKTDNNSRTFKDYRSPISYEPIMNIIMKGFNSKTDKRQF